MPSLALDYQDHPCLTWTDNTENEEGIYFLSWTEPLASGTLLSSAYDTGAESDWNTITWDAVIPDWTDMKIRTRTSPDSLLWSEWSQYYRESGSSISGFPDRWIQYEITMESSNTEFIPVLDEIRIN